MATKHLDTGEYIQAQQERIERLQTEIRQRNPLFIRSDATDAEIAQAIIRAYSGRLGGIASELVAHLTAMRTKARRSPTIKDVMSGKDFIVEA